MEFNEEPEAPEYFQSRGSVRRLEHETPWPRAGGRRPVGYRAHADRVGLTAERFFELDLAFHACLAQMTQNPLLE